MSKKALITGIGGQDGLFLASLLHGNGYEVHGLLRPEKAPRNGSLQFLPEEIRQAIATRYGNVTSKEDVETLIRSEQFDEIYHLAAQSSVARSIKHPRETIENNVLGLTNVATAVRDHSPTSRLLFSGSSEMFGDLTEETQNEQTPPSPQSPYGLTKELGYQLIKSYRKHYGLWAATAILFNHESEFRGEQFVTKKIIGRVSKIASGDPEPLALGNIHVKRDWGYAEDYMQGVMQMLAQPNPDDFVFATGRLHSVKDFVDIAFRQAGIELSWSGSGLEESARDASNDRLLVRIDEAFYRPGEIQGTCGDASKAKEILGWQPRSSLEEIISKMFQHEKTISSA